MRLDTFISDYGDGIHGTPTYSDNGEYCFINGNNLNDGCIVVDDNTLRINSDEYERIKRPLSDRTVLLSINGSLGKTALYNGEKIALGKSACYINIKETYSREFFRYILTTKEFQDYMLRVAHGSTIKNFAPSQVGEYEIELPDISEHKAIGCLLSTLDHKIANNSSVCFDLEAMSKLLYDYWFVQFDFPDENGKPYKSSGGKMVWNEQLKREIPEGWEVASISRIAKVLSGGTPNKSVNEYWYNGKIPFFGPTDYQHSVFQFDTKDHITENGLNACASSLFDIGTIIITARGSIGKKVIVGTPMAMNQSCYAFRPYNIEFVPYVYFVTEQVIEHLKVKSTGSVFKSIIIDDIEASLMPIGAEKVISMYCKIVKPMLDKVMSLEMENHQLISLRDFLLPILMNGQVKIEG